MTTAERVLIMPPKPERSLPNVLELDGSSAGSSWIRDSMVGLARALAPREASVYILRSWNGSRIEINGS